MIFSRGLIISLGFTIIVSIALYFLIRTKFSSIENKVNILFQLVQDEANNRNHKEQLSTQNTIISKTNRINVSDDEEESDEESDEEYDSSEDERDDEERNDTTNNIKYLEIKNMELDNNNIATIEEIEENNDIVNDLIENADNTNNLDNTEQETHQQGPPIQVSPQQGSPIQETLENTEDNKIFLSNNVADEQKFIEEITKETKSLKKMTVGELRDLVSEKGLHEEPKKLKKNELIELLEQ